MHSLTDVNEIVCNYINDLHFHYKITLCRDER